MENVVKMKAIALNNQIVWMVIYVELIIVSFDTVEKNSPLLSPFLRTQNSFLSSGSLGFAEFRSVLIGSTRFCWVLLGSAKFFKKKSAFLFLLIMMQIHKILHFFSSHHMHSPYIILGRS